MNFHLLGLLLVASLIVNGAQCLRCYQCAWRTNNTECNSAGTVACSVNSTEPPQCGTMLLYAGSNYIVTKKCVTSSECITGNIFSGAYDSFTVAVSCCQSDGCNVNAAPPRLLRPGHAAAALLVLGFTSWALM